jgi:hypothetical protein
MPENVTTVIAALIGALIGSVGAVVVENLYKTRAEELRMRQNLTQRYLFQLQESIEALWFRLDNLAFRQGRSAMEEDYFETSTLYALGRVLAIERILAIEGIYPQLESTYPQLGQFLQKRRIDLQLQGIGFYQYDRIALAEAVMELSGQDFRASTYLEFRKRYQGHDSTERQWLAPAKEAIQQLTGNKMQDLLELLREIAIRISEQTKITSSLKVLDDRSDAQSA